MNTPEENYIKFKARLYTATLPRTEVTGTAYTVEIDGTTWNLAVHHAMNQSGQYLNGWFVTDIETGVVVYRSNFSGVGAVQEFAAAVKIDGIGADIRQELARHSKINVVVPETARKIQP